MPGNGPIVRGVPHRPTTRRSSLATLGALGPLVGFALLCALAVAIGVLCDADAAEDVDAAPGERIVVRLAVRRTAPAAGTAADRALVSITGRAPRRRGAAPQLRVLRVRPTASCPVPPVAPDGRLQGTAAAAPVAWSRVAGTVPGRRLRSRRRFAMSGAVVLGGPGAVRLCAYAVRGGQHPMVQRMVSAVVPDRAGRTPKVPAKAPEARRASVPLRPGALALITTVALGSAWLLRRGTGGSGRDARRGHRGIGPDAATAGLTLDVLTDPQWDDRRIDTADLPSLPVDFRIPDAPPVVDAPWAGDADADGATDDGPEGEWIQVPDHLPASFNDAARANGTPRTAASGGVAPAAARRFSDLRVEHPAVHVLHDLCIPHSPARIDHVLIGPGGVVVANTKDYAGRVRSDGIDLRVRGRNRSAAVDVCLWQAETVRATLERAGLGLVPVHGVLHWLRPGGLGSQRIDLRGVRLLTARGTMDVATGADFLDPEVAERVALVLRSAFPSA